MTAEPHLDHSTAECTRALGQAFGFLGKRWNGMIIWALQAGPVGFAELRRNVGPITDSVLSDRLSELAVLGLVVRTVTDTRPPGVTYDLTDPGRTLLPVLQDLGGWAGAHLPSNCPTSC